MRHGDALPVGGAILEDAQRPLSGAGRHQVMTVAKGFQQRVEDLEIVFSSPLRRAEETAGIMGGAMGLALIETSRALAPNASPAGIRALLKSQADIKSMLWVAHHPDVTLWTAIFTGLDPSVCPLFGTASIAALQFDSSFQKAEFLWFQTSEQLALK
jgi:phosphohistidine phosphatase SixA